MRKRRKMRRIDAIDATLVIQSARWETNPLQNSRAT
jgi:hypothetical protein